MQTRIKSLAITPVSLAGVAISVPWLLVHSPVLGLAAQRAFALVCHQHADRSFVLFGGTVAVCARCLGIYLGAAMGLLLRMPRQFAERLLLAAAAINLTDWLAEIAGLHGNWTFTRFALGLVLGSAAAMLVTASIDDVNVPAHAKAV